MGGGGGGTWLCYLPFSPFHSHSASQFSLSRTYPTRLRSPHKIVSLEIISPCSANNAKSTVRVFIACNRYNTKGHSLPTGTEEFLCLVQSKATALAVAYLTTTGERGSIPGKGDFSLTYLRSVTKYYKSLPTSTDYLKSRKDRVAGSVTRC